jgi:histidine triad (HIT) family protein
MAPSGTGSKGELMAGECIFCKIVEGGMPADKVYEDDEFLAFRDIKPAAPVHLLVIPKRHIARLSDAKAEDGDMLGRLLLLAGHIAREQGLDAYRLIVNDGAGAGQTIFHLHAHILSGGEMSERLL